MITLTIAGPRQSGKTALIAWLVGQFRLAGISVEVKASGFEHTRRTNQAIDRLLAAPREGPFQRLDPDRLAGLTIFELDEPPAADATTTDVPTATVEPDGSVYAEDGRRLGRANPNDPDVRRAMISSRGRHDD